MSHFESEPPLIPAPIVSVTSPPSLPPVLSGPLGLRAGWGIAIFFIVAAVLGMLLFLGLAKGTAQFDRFRAEGRRSHEAAERAERLHLRPQPQPVTIGFSLLLEVPQAAAVLLSALGLSFLEQRRFAVYGLPSHRLRDLVPGALWGLAAMGLLIALLHAFHLLVFDAQLLHGAVIVRFGLAWLLMFLLVGVFEEFLFRGYIQFTLMRGLLGLARRVSPRRERLFAFWISALIWSGLFFAAHISNAGENPAGLAGVFVAGILFSYALWRTGSLWWGIGFHMSWDWAQSFLFGVPDSGILSAGRMFATHAAGRPLLSGGVDGPEGSLLLIPVLLLVFLVIRMHRQAEQPTVEPEPLPAALHSAAPEPIA